MKIKNADRFISDAKTFALFTFKGAYHTAVTLGIGAALLGTALTMVNVETIHKADLNARPSYSSSGQGIKAFNGKVAKLGEYDAPLQSLMTYGKLLGKWQHLLPFTSPRGFSLIDNDMRISSDHDVCMISSKQYAGKRTGFYDFPGATFIAEKDKFDFYIQSHETAHCGFHVIAENMPEDDQNLRTFYVESVQETAADLAAILDYMRLTGKDDLYRDAVKPFRAATLEDLSHTTMAALDVILEGVNPESIKGARPEDIPFLVNHLMAKHMFFEDYGYDLFQKTEIVDDAMRDKIHSKPAVLAMMKEMSGRVEIMRNNFNDEDAVMVRNQIKQVLVQQMDAYGDSVPEALLLSTLENQNELFQKLDLHEMELDFSEPRTAQLDENITGRGIYDFYVNAR